MSIKNGGYLRIEFFVLISLFITLFLFGSAEVVWGWRAFAICIAITMFVPIAVYNGTARAWRDLPFLTQLGAVLFLIVAVGQIVPLPPFIWSYLPGQEMRVAVLEQAGLSNYWMPISLTPIYSIYGALLFIALYFIIGSIIELSDREMQVVYSSIILFVLTGIMIGIFQTASAGAYFKFYKFTDSPALVGFFANKNHMALTMACSIPFAALLNRQPTDHPTKPGLLFFLYWAFIALMIPLTNSRAGLVMLIVISVFVAWDIFLLIGRRTKLILIFIALLAVPITLYAPLPAELARRFNDIGQDLRWPMLSHSMDILREYWIFGSGLGSFADVYLNHEHLDWLFTTYVNNVHNDYVQLAIEMGVGGIAALAILAAGIIISARRGLALSDPRQRSEVLMGLAILTGFALHSIVDYPLRRPAAMVVFAVGLAVMFRAARKKPDAIGSEDALVDGHNLTRS